MAQTKVHLDPAVLEDLQALAARSEENLDHLLNRLLREALDRHRLGTPPSSSGFMARWITKDMKAKVDLSDKDALHEILDRSEA